MEKYRLANAAARTGKKPALAVFAALLGLLPAACTTTSLQDISPKNTAEAPLAAAVPLPAPAPRDTAAGAAKPEPAPVAKPEPAPVAKAAADVGAPSVTGQFPNLNTAPEKAAPELSADEKAALIAELNAARAANAAGPSAEGAAKVARLRELARKHGVAALKEIEK